MLEWLGNNIVPVLEIASYIIAAAGAIAVLTPNTVDNAVVNILRKLIDFLALNWGNAKNEKKS